MAPHDNATLRRRLNEALHEINQLKGRIHELELELAQTNQNTLDSFDPVQLSPSVSLYTPTAKPTMRHNRCETPQQLFLKLFISGKVFTLGMEPQNDRGLLHDYFEDVRKWAAYYTVDLDVQEVARSSSFGDAADLLGGKSDIQDMLADREMRHDLVAALVIREIVCHSIEEASMFNSSHHAGLQCHQLFSAFAMLPQEDYVAKHQLSLQQAELYRSIYEERGHKKWRTDKAKDRTKELLVKLSCFLQPDVDPDREHWLSELYVKAYRINVRLRSDPVKWQTIFPIAGMRLDPHHMVHRTHNIEGDQCTTYMVVTSNPSRYFVRFAMTPAMIKTDFSGGREKKEVVHLSVVYIGRNDIFSHKEDLKMAGLKKGRRF